MDLSQIKKIHFLGIGGIGMSALAKYFLFKGAQVSGYDKVETDLTKELSNNGARIFYNDDVDLLPSLEDLDIVVYTPAVSSDNKQYKFVNENNLPLFKRAKVLGSITKDYNTIAVAGTHGKTTTSSIAAHLLHQCNKGGVAFLGGITSNYNSNILLSNNNIAVVEADEYDRSFLELEPNTIVLTSMDADHLDIYGEEDGVIKSFIEFASLVKEADQLIVEESIKDFFNQKLSYGFGKDSDLQMLNLKIKDNAYSFDFKYKGKIYYDFSFSLPGKYNLLNAAGAAFSCLVNGLSFSDIKKGLSSFKGVKRRFEIHYDTPECTFIDDYAHHPKEIEVLLNAIKEFYPKRKILGVFQPHLYSRTRDFMDEFATALSQLDQLILLPIYPAREEPIDGVSSKVLIGKVKTESKLLAIQGESFYDRFILNETSVIVTIGAGNIDLHVPLIKRFLAKND